MTLRQPISLKDLAVLIPAIAIGLWTAAIFIFCPQNADANSLRVLVMRVIFLLQLPFVCIFGYRRLRAFDRQIENFYADTESRSARPTERMMAILVAGAILSAAANFFGRDFFDKAALLPIPSLLFSILLFAVGYVGKRRCFSVDNLVSDVKDPAPSVANHPEEPSRIISRLGDLMTQQRIFLRPDLRLSDVAESLGIGRTTLPQRINQELNLSFSDYFNNLRIEYACSLLSDASSDRMSLRGIAENSGFSSESSFYRAFRRHTGMTPKKFINSR